MLPGMDPFLRPGGPAMARPLVIAMDGPAGAGKSTVAKRLAARLGILRLDTGAMYRACTVRVLGSGIDHGDPAAVAALVNTLRVDFSEAGRVRLDGIELDEADIRSPATTAEIWRVANNPACRTHLVAQQRAIVAGREAVVEGRDATTVICPDAQLKIYLDASPAERARRRLAEWQAQGRSDLPDLAAVEAEITERDRKDSTRAVGALTMADDALHLMCDGMSVDEVVARLAAYSVQRNPFAMERLVADQVVVGRSRSPGYVRVAGGDSDDGWQLGLSNPSPGRMPGQVDDFTRNQGGRQAGTVLQGAAILALGGRGEAPGRIDALPMLPQTWYVIEPGCWHAVIQSRGTICAWAEATGIEEHNRQLSDAQIRELAQFVSVYLPR
ncbi:MAG TPA: (d)CMP kinase [Planctomycetes bacterium]|nr:(d)CMP kinase [Planctomycetota bacterium]